MAYTVGHAENYARVLDAEGELIKTGSNQIVNGEPYHGGIVFKTIQDAYDYLVENDRVRVWAIWELDTTWDEGKTVYKRDGEDFYRIIHDTNITRMIPK